MISLFIWRLALGVDDVPDVAVGVTRAGWGDKEGDLCVFDRELAEVVLVLGLFEDEGDGEWGDAEGDLCAFLGLLEELPKSQVKIEFISHKPDLTVFLD